MASLDGPVTGELVKSGSVRSVRLWFDGRFLLVGEDAPETLPDAARRWPLGELSLDGIPARGAPVKLRHRPSGAQLTLANGPFTMTLRSAANHLRAPVEERRTWRTLWLYMAGATAVAAVVVALSLEVLPDILVRVLPDSFGDRVGREVAEDLFPESIECSRSAGLAALSRLQRRFEPVLPPGTRLTSLRVVNLREANAVALPGGRVFIFRGLLEKASEPDGVAGVFAHEIGHVIEKHGLRNVIRQTGLSIALGILTSGQADGIGAVLGIGQALAMFSYSRDAERQADDWAIDILHQAGIDPAPLAELLEAITKGEGGTSFLQTHPATEERTGMIRSAARPGRPALSDPDWQDLRAICDDLPRPKSLIRIETPEQ